MKMSRFFSVALVVVLAVAVRSEPNDWVNILKCCRMHEELVQPSPNSTESEIHCVASQKEWNPRVYYPTLNNMTMGIPKFWKIRESKRPVCNDKSVLTYMTNSLYSTHILSDLGLLLLELGDGPILGPQDHCVDANGFYACIPKQDNNGSAAATPGPQVLRCCGSKSAFDDEKMSCIHVEEDDDGPLVSNLSPSNTKRGFPKCPNGETFVHIGRVDNPKWKDDGSLDFDNIHLPAEEYCIERAKDANSKLISILACSEHKSNKSKSDIRFTLFPVGFIISAIFLAATLAAGCLLPASHHVLHWRCQTYHVFCLMMGDIFMAVIQLASNSLTGPYCEALAILAHIFFLATFFWLNTMCFNIWWTFRDLRPASLEKGQELLRLRFYGVYAWGGPLIVAGLAALLDHLPQSAEHTFLRPRFGEKQCWFYGDMEVFAYFYGPIGILLVINLIFFAATARELTCGLWKGEFVKSTTERAALGKVCMKLVVVMGVPWILDVISWMAGGPVEMWYVSDTLNALQGVFIFAVVGCQPQVRVALKRIWSRNPRTIAGRQGNGLSTTSHGMPSMGDSVTQNPSTKTAPLETIC